MPGAWQNHQQFRREIESEGWRTPNTYCRAFASVEDAPAVYLLAIVDPEKYRHSLVAYVGMSKRLRQRLAQHSVLSELNKTDFYIMRWFLPVPPDDLRKVESHYIAKFDPPWNLAGRTRGIAIP